MEIRVETITFLSIQNFSQITVHFFNTQTQKFYLRFYFFVEIINGLCYYYKAI